MLLVIGSVSFSNRCQALRGDEIGLLTVIVEASPLAGNRFRPILILILFHHPVVIDVRNHLMTLRIGAGGLKTSRVIMGKEIELCEEAHSIMAAKRIGM